MEYEEEEQRGGLLQRIQESPRTVSALIIILIVAAAIYAFSGDEIDPTQPIAQNNATNEEVANDEDANGEDEDANGEEVSGEDEVDDENEQPTTTPTDREELAESAEELPEATRTDQGFVEVAQSGEGITHLARKATTRWLSENSPDYTITQEHRIYIEDYIQKRVGTEGLNLGETRTISFDLIQEAVTAAGQLSDQQLQNLSQYTHAL